MSDKIAYLTYNELRGDAHKGITLDHRGLTAEQVQMAIDIVAKGLRQMQQDDKTQVVTSPPGVCWSPVRLLDKQCGGCRYMESCTNKRKGVKKK